MHLENSLKVLKRYKATFEEDPDIVYGDNVPVATPEIVSEIDSYEKVGVAEHYGMRFYIIKYNGDKLVAVPEIELEEDYLWRTAFPPSTHVDDDHGLEIFSNDIIATENGGYIVSGDWQYEKNELNAFKRKKFIGTLRRIADGQWDVTKY